MKKAASVGFLSLLLLFFCFSCLLSSASAEAEDSTAPHRVVRVGFFPFEGYYSVDGSGERHVEVQPDHKAIALKELNEAARHQKAQPGTAPAHQSLCPDTAMGTNIIFRLVPDLEFPFSQRLFHTAFHLLIEGHMILKGSIEKAHRVRLVGSQIRTAHSLCYGQRWMPQVAYAHLHRNPGRQFAYSHIFMK